MLSNAVKSYLSTAKGLPFFYAVGDEDYNEVLSELSQNGVIVDRISQFCPKEDKFPDIDDVIDHFRTLDMDYRQNKHVLTGLGEFLALRGSVTTEKTLRRLNSTTLGTARVILLLRCVTQQVNKLALEERRISEQGRVYISGNAFSSVSVTCVKYAVWENGVSGIKGLLRNFEDGLSGRMYVNSSLDYSGSLIPVAHIDTAFAALNHAVPGMKLSENLGTEEQWDRLYQEIVKCNSSLDNVFSRYGFEADSEDELYENCSGLEYRNWLFFVFLKLNAEYIQNAYLKYVVLHTDSFDCLKSNILTTIVAISRDDPLFDRFYFERKRLVRSFPESDIALFVHENSVDPMESIYRFTDNTRMEREAILNWIAQHGYIDAVKTVYPALGHYLQSFVYDCGALTEFVTTYFKEYRMQKVTNQISPEFLLQVKKNAEELPYTRLESRDSAVLRISEKDSAFLYWIDALGIEYLPYITFLAKKKGLSIHTDITYAELPTITSINKGFYDRWPGPKKQKESQLDDIKHKKAGGFFYEPGQAAIHLSEELNVIERAINTAATQLAMHTCKSFVIASDHGASRLAVIHHQEEKYETDTKGEHSGRCCKDFPEADLPYAIRENGYLVLGDYGRFKNSRAANVEVHGGASLEEVIVPVIVLSLKKQNDLTVKLLNEKAIFCDRHEGTSMQLYISDVENGDNIGVVINEKRYTASAVDSSHFLVSLKDIKRAKKNVIAEIYDGDDLIGTVTFDIKGKMATMSSDFDDLF